MITRSTTASIVSVPKTPVTLSAIAKATFAEDPTAKFVTVPHFKHDTVQAVVCKEGDNAELKEFIVGHTFTPCVEKPSGDLANVSVLTSKDRLSLLRGFARLQPAYDSSAKDTVTKAIVARAKKLLGDEVLMVIYQTADAYRLMTPAMKALEEAGIAYCKTHARTDSKVYFVDWKNVGNSSDVANRVKKIYAIQAPDTLGEADALFDGFEGVETLIFTTAGSLDAEKWDFFFSGLAFDANTETRVDAERWGRLNYPNMFSDSVAKTFEESHFIETRIRPDLKEMGWRIVKVCGEPGSRQEKGLPDFIVMRDGVAVLLEVKSRSGALSPRQKEACEDFRKHGMHCEAFRITEWEQVKRKLLHFCAVAKAQTAPVLEAVGYNKDYEVADLSEITKEA